MAGFLEVTIASPERKLFSGSSVQLSCWTPQGQITVLPHHAPLVSVLAVGEIVLKDTDGGFRYFQIDGGFIEITLGGKVTVLADAAAHVAELDEKAALEAKARAAAKLYESNLSDEEYVKAFSSLERSISRLNIIRKHAHRRKSPITGQGVIEQ